MEDIIFYYHGTDKHSLLNLILLLYNGGCLIYYIDDLFVELALICFVLLSGL